MNLLINCVLFVGYLNAKIVFFLLLQQKKEALASFFCVEQSE